MTCCKSCEPYPSCCWPDDPHFSEGAVELRVPSSAALRAYWHADILDTNGVPPGTIIKTGDGFDVRFRVELKGELWKCITGCWCFNLGFTSIGRGQSFDLSELVNPSGLQLKNWKGCAYRCKDGDASKQDCFSVELTVRVPPNTIPADYCGSLYECGGRVAFYCCCDDQPQQTHDADSYLHDDQTPILIGFDALEEREFYR